jgi:hypothetical protein
LILTGEIFNKNSKALTGPGNIYEYFKEFQEIQKNNQSAHIPAIIFPLEKFPTPRT